MTKTNCYWTETVWWFAGVASRLRLILTIMLINFTPITKNSPVWTFITMFKVDVCFSFSDKYLKRLWRFDTSSQTMREASHNRSRGSVLLPALHLKYCTVSYCHSSLCLKHVVTSRGGGGDSHELISLPTHRPRGSSVKVSGVVTFHLWDMFLHRVCNKLFSCWSVFIPLEEKESNVKTNRSKSFIF